MNVVLAVNLLTANGTFQRPLMSFAINLIPYMAPQNMGPRRRSKLFDIQIYISEHLNGINAIFIFQTLKD